MARYEKQRLSLVRENIYAPCGMVNTDCYELDRPVPNLAIGYMKDGDDGRWRNNMLQHSVKGGPAGGGSTNCGLHPEGGQHPGGGARPVAPLLCRAVRSSLSRRDVAGT